MQIRIETTFTPLAVKAYLEAHDLKLPVFFEKNANIVLLVDRNNRTAALQFVDWLLPR